MTPKPRRHSTCHRHPSEPVTGFCALCLRDRLSGLDTPSPSSAANAASTSFQPELRRCKSHAAGKRGGAAYSTSLEPRRKSCDDRVRKENSLWHLFSLDDKENGVDRGPDVESKNLGLSAASDSATEPAQNINLRVSEDPLGENGNGNEDKGEEATEEEAKTMKEHIEHEWQSGKHNRKDLKDIIAGNFLVAASVFGKKLRNWRVKQTTKKQTCDLLPGQKVNAWKRKENRSEATDYACRRRSCDAEPRFSMDANGISLDDHPRFSLDEPRASWDGYMIARTIPRLAPMLSVIENAIVNENETTSGGSAQTRDYCSDSSSSLRRDNSFDCSSSGKSSSKKTVALEVDEMRSIKFVVSDGDGRGDERREGFESGCKSGDSVGGCGDPNGFKKSGRWRKGWSILGFMHRRQEEKCGEVEGDGNGRMVGDCGEKQNGEANGVVINGDSNRGEADGDSNRDEANGAMVNGDSNGRLVRSGSVSYRSSHTAIGSYHRSLSVAETRDYGKKSREDSGVERNRNATMYSPSNLENGLLRFHLTPSWSHRKKSGRSRLRNSDSISTRSMFRLD